MSDEGRAVVRRTRGEWRAITSRFERRGPARREFCEPRGLVQGTFPWWCRELGWSGPDGGRSGMIRASQRWTPPKLPTAQVEALRQGNAQLTATVSDLAEQLAQLQRQVEWFKRQLFGSKVCKDTHEFGRSDELLARMSVLSFTLLRRSPILSA